MELLQRKYNGEVYHFHIHEMCSCGDEAVMRYITCETPCNGFGYTDTVMYDRRRAYTLHRYLQPWILNKIKIQIEKLMAANGI